MPSPPKGTLIIIGGNEDKSGDGVILQEVARRVRRRTGPLVVMTVATQLPDEVAADYREAFARLGVHDVEDVDIRTREDACDPARLEVLEQAAAVFFTGGDQLRITSQVGDTPTFQFLHRFYRSGGLIVGTSAGAAAMPETMLVGGASDVSHSTRSIAMAAGMGFLPRAVIDSHFAERGRMGRLLGAVVQNPKNVGLGIDENTAIVVSGGSALTVLGEGALYVVDGSTITYSSLSEADTRGVVRMENVRLHVLGDGDCFDLFQRCTIRADVPTEADP